MSMATSEELRALNERYFHALDQCDLAAVGACFTDNAESIYLGGEWILSGREQLVERLQVIRTFASSIHVPTTMSFSSDGDRATGTVYAIAHIAIGDGDVARLAVRGLRYVDEYTREGGTWRIRTRRQDPLWQYEVPTVPPEIPGQQAQSEH
jgi:hypothetical protein